jgi:hypothetical protein
VTGDRARGVVLYATAALVLVAGLVWWVLARPQARVDPRVEAWKASAEALLPFPIGLDGQGMVTLAAEAEHDAVAEVGDGEFEVSMVCVGGEGSGVRVSLGDQNDSGLGMRCTDGWRPDPFRVSVGGQLHLTVSVGDAGPVVFRYSVSRVSA